MARTRPKYIATEECSGELSGWGEGNTPAKALADWARQYALSRAGVENPLEVMIFKTKKKPPTYETDWWIFRNPEETIIWHEPEQHG